MGKINSRTKGNKGERVAAKVLETWTGKTFTRVPSSGGLGWHTSNSTGDIICSTEGHFFPFSVEVKLREKINFDHTLYLDKAEILKFWEQSVRDAQRVQKCPIVMMRYNGLPKDFFFILVPTEVFLAFFSDYLNPDQVFVNGRFTLFTTDLLQYIPYKKIRKPIKNHYRHGKG